MVKDTKVRLLTLGVNCMDSDGVTGRLSWASQDQKIIVSRFYNTANLNRASGQILGLQCCTLGGVHVH
jgi:hypothetical protein